MVRIMHPYIKMYGFKKNIARLRKEKFLWLCLPLWQYHNDSSIINERGYKV